MGTKAKKPRAMRSIKSGVKSFIRTSKNIEIINRLKKELQG
jgi:hypothetical protein